MATLSEEKNVLGRMLEPVARCFTPSVAKKIAELRADAELEARMQELSAKANEGELSDAEQSEYEAYIEAGDIIALLQAKARSVVKNSPA